MQIRQRGRLGRFGGALIILAGTVVLAILGILHESPMHGYELRKQLATKLGTLRAAISYGSLYPSLRRLQAAGWISEGDENEERAQGTGSVIGADGCRHGHGEPADVQCAARCSMNRICCPRPGWSR